MIFYDFLFDSGCCWLLCLQIRTINGISFTELDAKEILLWYSPEKVNL
jgi:hypothetical protein